MERQQLIFSNSVAAALDGAVAAINGVSSRFVLVDSNTERLVLPRLIASQAIADAHVITIPAGDEAKNIDTLATVWNVLQDAGATRRSLLINLGGGVVTDLGGFAAASFKRGLRFINVPTTLLAAVDAAVGGKTGINYRGMKNEIGAFAPACAVLLSTIFFDSLPATELRSGFAEMIKHAMLTGERDVDALLDFDLAAIDNERLLLLLRDSVAVKRRIVDEDPLEQGIRRALNLGHTAGHAFESLALERHRPVPHGYAVAWGLVVETVLSHLKLQFPSDALYRLASAIKELYGCAPVTCDDYPQLLHLMRHDKKSRHGEINCTLLRNYGDIAIDNAIDDDTLSAALDIYRDLSE